MAIRFFKMHGCGNDFIVIDGISNDLGLDDSKLRDLAKFMCDRHFGIGGDGLLYLTPSRSADFKMRLFNSDGSEGEMCGNGIRCAVKYYVENIKPLQQIKVETLAGIISVEQRVIEGNKYYAVDMGLPKLRAKEVPVVWRDPESRVFNAVIDVPDVGKVEFSAVNTGVPHAVIFVDNVDGIDARKLGRLIRQHTIFPKGVNVDFAEVVNSNTIRVRTYERGVEDETLCCGTGATAVAVIATLLGKVRKNEELMLRFRGGTLLLKVLVAGENVAKVTMMGTAHKIFEGLYNPD